jgi:hypothetical protein
MTDDTDPDNGEGTTTEDIYRRQATLAKGRIRGYVYAVETLRATDGFDGAEWDRRVSEGEELLYFVCPTGHAGQIEEPDDGTAVLAPDAYAPDFILVVFFDGWAVTGGVDPNSFYLPDEILSKVEGAVKTAQQHS